MNKPITKQLQVYQYVIDQNHTPHEAMKHFGCSESFVCKCIKIESARHGVTWKDKRLYQAPKVE